MGSNSEIQEYKVYSMLHFCRKFSGGITMAPLPITWLLLPIPLILLQVFFSKQWMALEPFAGL